MPYLMEILNNDSLIETVTTPKPFGPGLTEEERARATRVEVWASTCSDPSEWVEWRLMDAGGVFRICRVNGY